MTLKKKDWQYQVVARMPGIRNSHLLLVGIEMQKYKIKWFLESQTNLALEYKMKQGKS